MYAAMAAGRNSVGVEIDKNFKNPILSRIDTIVPYSNERIQTRIESHLKFVEEYHKTKGGLKYLNNHYKFPIMTRQEINLFFNQLLNVKITTSKDFEVAYSDEPQPEFCGGWEAYLKQKTQKPKPQKKQQTQLKLLG